IYSNVIKSTSGMSNLSPFKKRVTAKCALFTSPSKSSVSRNDNKRKRTDSDDLNPPKLFRSVSLQETASSISNNKREILKVRSEMNISSQHAGELSAHHKKKLQWAVYEALRGQNIGINHPQFKQFASVLARVTRRFLPNLAANAPRPEGGTSERMLRIARQHIHAVMLGKSVDEIIQKYEIHRLKNIKPLGYVGLEIQQNDTSIAKNKENVFRDRLNTMSNEKIKLGLNRDELIKTTLSKVENRMDRVRRMIKFDDENNSDIR
ncbi:glycoside hydrolase, partial [Oryctes borbonicus]